MSLAQIREIAAAQRLENVRYAIRDLALVADEVTREGHTVLSLNVGDPNIFDFQTPAHLIEAVYRAMRDNKNGYAPSPGITEALDAIRAEAARKSISSVQDVFVTTGVSETVDICLTVLINPGENILTPSPDYPLYSAVLSKLGIPITTYDLNEHDEWQPDLVDIQRKISARTRTDLPLDVDESGLPFVVLIEVVGGDLDAKLREDRGIERVVGTGRQYVFPRIDQRSQAEIHRLAYACCDKHVLN